MSMGEKLYYFRKRSQLSQDNVAEYLNVSRQAVSKWENDQSHPDTNNLIKLAELYHVTLDELIGNKKPIDKDKSALCAYCHQAATFYYEDNPFCSNECQIKYEQEMRSIQKNLKWFYLGIGLGVVILLGSAFFPNETVVTKGVGIGMVVTGMTIVLFPYCTPLTYEMYGFKKTQILGRVLGMVCELFGLWMFFLW